MHEIFFLFFSTYQIYIVQRKFFEYFLFCFGSDPVDVESHSLSTESTSSETSRRVSQCRVRLTSAESIWNDETFVNMGAFRIDSANVESHSELTQLTESLTLHRLSVRKMKKAYAGIHNH